MEGLRVNCVRGCGPDLNGAEAECGVGCELNRSGSRPILPMDRPPMLNWLIEEKQITPHIPVIDKSKREEPSS